jgi:hypothetical protein
VKHTLDFGIMYNISKDPILCRYTYSNLVGCGDDRKLTSSYVFSLGMSAVTWIKKKKHAVAISSTKEEYR